MSIDPAIVESFGSQVLGNLYLNSKWAQAFLDASAFGAVTLGNKLHIPSVGVVTTGAYDRSSATPLKDIAKRAKLTSQALDIDRDEGFRVDLDVSESYFTNLDLVSLYAAEAAGALDEDLDVFLAQRIIAGGTKNGSGTAASPEELDGADLKAIVTRLNVAMMNNRAPANGRLLYLPSWAHGLLSDLDDFTPEFNDEKLRTGVVGVYKGARVVVTPDGLQAKLVDGEDSADCIVMTTGMSNAMASALNEFNIVSRQPDAFGSAVIGRQVGGAKVLRASHTLYVPAVQK